MMPAPFDHDDPINPGASGLVLPVRKTPFLPSDDVSIRRLGIADPDALTVYLFHDVADEVLFTSTFRPAQINAGILVGGYYAGPAGDYVEIRGFRDAIVVDRTLDFAKRLREIWRSLQTDRTLREAGLIPVGWFISKPSSRAVMSPEEAILHLSYFNLEFHTCLILDPLSKKVGLYHRPTGIGIENIGFNLIRVHSTEETDSEDSSS